MPRRLHLVDAPVLHARPVYLEIFELADTRWRALAKERGQGLVAEPAAGGERVLKMHLGIVGLRFPERRRAGHLRHDARAPAPHHVLVDEHDARACARGGNGRKHAGGTAARHQYVRLDMDGVVHGNG